MDDADTPTQPEPEAVSLIPEAIARTLRLAPLSAGARTLTIAVAAPLSGEQLNALTQITGRQLLCQVEPGPHVVDSLIELAYGDSPRADSASAA